MSSHDSEQSPTSSAFEAVAHAYELLVNEASRWSRERPFLERWVDGVRHHREGAPPRILDAGCGTGFHARHLAQYPDIASVVGADPSREMLDIAARRPGGDRVQWIQRAAHDPPAGPFDLVLLVGNTLSLIESVEPVFARTADVVESGGVFIVQMLNYESLRADGLHPRIVERSDERVRIRKELAPRERGGPVAAELSLTVFDSQGREISHEHHNLHEHAEEDWLSRAKSVGWSLEERRSRYDDSNEPGGDRIYILRRD